MSWPVTWSRARRHPGLAERMDLALDLLADALKRGDPVMYRAATIAIEGTVEAATVAFGDDLNQHPPWLPAHADRRP